MITAVATSRCTIISHQIQITGLRRYINSEVARAHLSDCLFSISAAGRSVLLPRRSLIVTARGTIAVGL